VRPSHRASEPIAALRGAGARVIRATVAHTPRDPFVHGEAALQGWHDGAVAIDAGGRVLDVGDAAEVRARHPDLPVEDERGAVLLPGFVDAHVHYPQLQVLGAMGLRLIDWLALRTFPLEARFADAELARREARRFLSLLAANGTTAALVFGAHYAVAMEAFFHEAAASGLRITAGLVVADAEVPEALATTPELAFEESLFLARRWHGVGRLRYAVTPRFSLSSTVALLEACGAVASSVPGVTVTSHLNETPAEIEVVRRRFPGDRDYLATYERHGLVRSGSVFAHDVHPTDEELRRLAAAGAAVAHCPSSNQFLGSGLFPFRAHLRDGVTVALGTDIGGGTGLSLLNEGLMAYQGQMLLGGEGEPLTPARLLWLATAAGARALGLEREIGDLSPGRSADLVLLRPRSGSTLAEVLPEAASLDAAIAVLFTLAREDAVAATLVQGEVVHARARELGACA
jgi:guanine deaminase